MTREILTLLVISMYALGAFLALDVEAFTHPVHRLVPTQLACPCQLAAWSRP